MVVDGDDAHRLADLVGYFLLGRARAFARRIYTIVQICLNI